MAGAWKAVPGRDNAASFQTQAAGYFSSGRSRVQGVSPTENKCKKNVLFQVCVRRGSLVEHWLSDWMITCYCLIIIRIIKVINWL